MAEYQHVKGLRELEQNLKMLGSELREKGVKRMMSQAAVPIREDAKRRAPVLQEPDPRRKAGTVRDRIRVWRRRGTQFAVTYYVGVAGLSRKAIRTFKQSSGKNSSENPDDPFYWRWVELGTSKKPAQPFLRPAFESRKQEAVQVAVREAQNFIRRMRFKRLAGIVRRGLA